MEQALLLCFTVQPGGKKEKIGVFKQKKLGKMASTILGSKSEASVDMESWNY